MPGEGQWVKYGRENEFMLRNYTLCRCRQGNEQEYVLPERREEKKVVKFLNILLLQDSTQIITKYVYFNKDILNFGLIIWGGSPNFRSACAIL